MVRSIRQLEALKDDWNALAEQFRTPLLEHEWFLSCAEAFYPDRDLSVMTTERQGRLAGVAPLVMEATASGPRLMLLGASKLFEPGGWIFDSDDALDDLLISAVAAGEAMLLQRIPEDSPLCRAVAAVPRRQALTLSKTGTRSLAVPTGQRWDAYVGGLSSHLTGNLRRWRTKAERRLGPVHYACLDPRPDQVPELLETFSAVEGSGWKGRRGSALGSRRDLRDFFERYCHRAAARGRLRVATLAFGSAIAAMEISIEAYKRMWQLKIGFQESLSEFYPGIQLSFASIRSAFERGLESYEFLGSAEPWQERWHPEARQYRLLTVYPMTLRGLRGFSGDVIGALRRRISRRKGLEVSRPAPARLTVARPQPSAWTCEATC